MNTNPMANLNRLFQQGLAGGNGMSIPQRSKPEGEGAAQGGLQGGVQSPFQLPPIQRFEATTPSEAVSSADISKPQPVGGGFYASRNHATGDAYTAAQTPPSGQRLLIDA